MKLKNQTKIAIITNMPTPYRKKQWENYSNIKNLEITVYYCTQSEKDRKWEFFKAKNIKEIFLYGISYKNFHFNPSILKIVRNYDLFFLGGFEYPTLILTIIMLKILKKPWILIYDGISPKKIQKEKFFVKIIKKWLISHAQAYLANGKISEIHFRNYGISPNKIFNQYLTVDIDYFINKKGEGIKNRILLREKYNFKNDSIVVLYVGRLIPNKGVDDLIKAIKSINQDQIDINCLIVGDGTEKEYLEKLSKKDKRIIFTNHVKPEELYKYYYASDIFVLPTKNDPWGLVINEAMACGLPIIVTSAAGCSLDLLKDNGFVIEPNNVIQLKKSILKLETSDIREKMGNQSLKIIKKWSYKKSSKNLFEIIKYVLETKF